MARLVGFLSDAAGEPERGLAESGQLEPVDRRAFAFGQHLVELTQGFRILFQKIVSAPQFPHAVADRVRVLCLPIIIKCFLKMSDANLRQAVLVKRCAQACFNLPHLARLGSFI